MPAEKSDLIDLQVYLHAETDKAIRVSTDNSDAVWLPKSQIEISDEGRATGERETEITLPQWLAEHRGLA